MLTGAALSALLAGGAFAVQASPQAAPQPVPVPVPVTAAPVPSASLLPGTQALFDSYVADRKMPGIVGAFGMGDLPTVFVSAGHISNDPGAASAGPDSLWRVYSMTKPITAMAAMILIQDGKMTLDEPISDFIPAFKNMRVQLNENTLDSRPATRPITVRNLLTHTAGLGYNIITKGPLLDDYNKHGITPGAINAQFEAQMRPARPTSLAEFADRVAAEPLIADPGTKWSYSIGLDLMGAVIEKASGMPFDRFVQTRILDPLKMNSTYWTVPQSEAGRLATNYTFVGGAMLPVDPGVGSLWLKPPSFPYGGAGLVMSARDYDRFLHMLQDGGTLDGVRVMKPETVALAMSNLLPPGVEFGGAVANTGGQTTGPKMGFGAGGSVILESVPGGPSKGTYGWGGAAGTIAWVDPARHARGTVMVNYFPGEQWPLRADVGKALFADMARYGQQ